MSMLIMWLVIAVISIIIELVGTDFVFLMIGGGAIGAGVSALATDSLTIQLAVFAVLSLALLLILRPIIKRHLQRDLPNQKMNIDAVAGRPCHAVTDVTCDGGRVSINGEAWTAKTVGDEVLPKGAKGTVTDVDGATAIVTRWTGHKLPH